MNNFIGKKVLITTNAWFYAPDGRQYRSVCGTLKAIHEAGKSLGFIPNRSHANWFIEVSNTIIMGCQVMYIVQADTVNKDYVKDWTTPPDNATDAKEYTRPCAIYFADEKEAAANCDHVFHPVADGSYSNGSQKARCVKCGYEP